MIAVGWGKFYIFEFGLKFLILKTYFNFWYFLKSKIVLRGGKNKNQLCNRNRMNRVGWTYYLLLLFWLLPLLQGCNTAKPAAKPAKLSFYKQLRLLCGKKVNGAVLYPSGAEAPFRGMDIWLEITRCSDQEIRMPIYIDNKIYRTLIIGQDETGYTLRHENRRPNGTQADFSMYGGHTTDAGTGYLLIFPADGYTKQLMGPELNYVWSLAFNSEKTTLSYMAESNGKLNLQFDFNLASPAAAR